LNVLSSLHFDLLYFSPCTLFQALSESVE
jgi:hypothetical protein